MHLSCHAVYRLVIVLLSFAVVPLCAEDRGQELIEASRRGNVAAVRELLDSGVGTEYTDEVQWTSLHLAAWHGYEEVVRLLLQTGADPEHADADGCNPLRQAALVGRYERTVQLLLAYGAQLPHDCATEQRRAVVSRRFRAVRSFLEHIEQEHALPRDLTRLIGGRFAGVPEEGLPPAYRISRDSSRGMEAFCPTRLPTLRDQ